MTALQQEPTTTQPSNGVAQQETTTDQKKGPAMLIRNGAIAASIWERTSGEGNTFYDYSLSRSWKTDEKEGYSQNMRARDKENLQKTIEEATNWIAEKTANKAS